MKDKNYTEIKIGATVDVPAPNSEDAHNNEFRGTVTSFEDGGYVVVEDMEENFYCIESERLEVIDLDKMSIENENGNLAKPLLAVRAIIKVHTEKLNTMKTNRGRSEKENWTDSEIQECDRMIAILASILSDLNRALEHETLT